MPATDGSRGGSRPSSTEPDAAPTSHAPSGRRGPGIAVPAWSRPPSSRIGVTSTPSSSWISAVSPAILSRSCSTEARGLTRPVSHRATTDCETSRRAASPRCETSRIRRTRRTRPGIFPSKGPMRYHPISSSVHVSSMRSSSTSRLKLLAMSAPCVCRLDSSVHHSDAHRQPRGLVHTPPFTPPGASTLARESLRDSWPRTCREQRLCLESLRDSRQSRGRSA